MHWLPEIALAGGLAWASGIRLYAVVFLAGMMSRHGFLDLPPALEVLEQPLVLGAAAVMLTAEFIADKIPAFDSLWDALHTFIRIPAGAVLAAGALGELAPVWVALAGLIGGSIASTAHATKSGSRALINTSPEPFSNWMASFTEDLMVPAGFWLAVQFPFVFLGLLLLFILLALWFLPILWRGVRRIVTQLTRVFS